MILMAVLLIGRERGLTQPKFEVTVLFRDVGGLIEGAPVQLAGVNVGTVSDIRFLDEEIQERRVAVQVSVFRKFKKQLEQRVRFSIQTEGILGEKLVEITVSKHGYLVDAGRPVIGEDPLDVQDLAEVFADAAASFTQASDDFSDVNLQDLSKVLSETAQALESTAQGINSVLTEMRYISIKSKRLLDRIEQRIIDGNLFKVF